MATASRWQTSTSASRSPQRTPVIIERLRRIIGQFGVALLLNHLPQGPEAAD
jgi:hypothetical protein